MPPATHSDIGHDYSHRRIASDPLLAASSVVAVKAIAYWHRPALLFGAHGSCDRRPTGPSTICQGHSSAVLRVAADAIDRHASYPPAGFAVGFSCRALARARLGCGTRASPPGASSRLWISPSRLAIPQGEPLASMRVLSLSLSPAPAAREPAIPCRNRNGRHGTTRGLYPSGRA